MTIRILLVVSFIFNLSPAASAQEIIYGTNEYVEYQVGTLPIVISVPHGGSLEPTSIPNRTCNDPVYATDAFTVETALEIKNHLYAATGCYPHIIISHLKRSKLDPNRNLADGACENAEAETAWTEFHGFIEVAQNAADLQFDENSFFVDLHGHGNPIQRIELGYLLYDDELELADAILNSTQYLNYSSIKNLALSNVNNYTHAQLLKGPYAFGTLLSNHSFPAVPSQDIPFPGTTTNYFSGGYITANHTCYASGVDVNGLQMELNYAGIRDTPFNRTQFAIAFADVAIEYMNTHFDMNWNACNQVSVEDFAPGNEVMLYPNPIERGELVQLNHLGKVTLPYSLYTVFGQLVKTGRVSPSGSILTTADLAAGVYVIRIMESAESKFVMKLIVK